MRRLSPSAPMTPASAIQFLETVLDAVDAEMVGNLVSPDEDIYLEKRRRMAASEGKSEDDSEEAGDLNDGIISSMPHVSSMVVADALLALCHVNTSPAFITDPTTGKPVQSSSSHPASINFFEKHESSIRKLNKFLVSSFLFLVLVLKPQFQ